MLEPCALRNVYLQVTELHMLPIHRSMFKVIFSAQLEMFSQDVGVVSATLLFAQCVQILMSSELFDVQAAA